MSAFFLGIAAGLLLAVPIAWFWTRRTAARVRQLEQRARSAERLAEIGTLTGGLAHEIKNPLSTVGLNIQLLDEDIADLAGRIDEAQAQRIRRRFVTLQRETQRLREILEDFLRFAGRLQLDRQPVDFNELVQELADFFEPQAHAAKVHLRTQPLPGDATVSADAGLLKQAVLNLMLNATQAMSHAREKGHSHGGADELLLRLERRRPLDHDEIHLHVTDTGPGIAEDVQAKIFQPYFSTKRTGTGLGLATARRIVEEHGGQLTVHSAPGQGTDFVLALPADGAVEKSKT